MRALKVCCLFLLIGTSQLMGEVSSTTYSLDMDQDPAAMGWTVYSSSGFHSVANGILTINSPTYYEFWAPTSIWQSVVNNATGYSVDARFRVTSATSSFGMTFWLHDNTILNKVVVNKDALLIYDGGPDVSYPYPIGNDWHDYHIEAIKEDIDVWVDGNLVADITHTGINQGTQTMYFGDGYNNTPTVSEWDYFRFTIPLPDPTGGLGTALLVTSGLMIRRRR